MTEPEIDYAALFRALPGIVVLLTPQLVYADANEEFVRRTGRTREQMIGHYLPDDARGDPDDPAVAVHRNLQASLCRVSPAHGGNTPERLDRSPGYSLASYLAE